jgi:hypothetical protein
MNKKIPLILIIQILSFTQLLSQAKSLPYIYNFETLPESEGWQQYRLGNDPGANAWTHSNVGFSGKSIYHGYNIGGDNSDTLYDWYVSCPILFSDTTNLSIKVKVSGFSQPFPNSIDVWFSDGSPDPKDGDFKKIANLSYMTPDFEWLDTTVRVNYTAPNGGYIAFKYYTNGAAWRTVSIDNLEVKGIHTSVNEHKLADLVKVISNETSTDFRFNAASNNRQLLVRMYTMDGSVNNIIDVTGLSSYTIDHSHFNSGLYVIEFQQNEIIYPAIKILMH